MTQPNADKLWPVSPQQLATELMCMRDAVVRLSLALEDYRVFVKSKGRPELAREVEELLGKIKTEAGK